MTDSARLLFDFSGFAARADHYRARIIDFASGAPFRSAAVEELVLDNDFHRRPLRPEDLSFLTFTRPVTASSVSRLHSLASQRTLLCLYELQRALPPPTVDAGRHAAFMEFCGERNRQHAAEILPFLEAYAFQYLCERSAQPTHADAVQEIYADELRFWERTLEQLSAASYLQEGLRFILIQRWCLSPCRHRAIGEARALGHFDGWPAESVTPLEPGTFDVGAMAHLAKMLGVDREQHAYWQFYLPTSLSKSNLLHALVRKPEHAFALYGALYGAQAEQLAFESALTGSCSHVVAAFAGAARRSHQQLAELVGGFESLAQHVEQRFGAAAAQQLHEGLACWRKLSERARWDLGEQLTWLSAIEQYCEYAREISRRIDSECPDIDRETFVEPRDMCSTTHVHNDHRLVTIEEGVMHFWGNLGMRLEMRRGDRVLIPQGRLHGSTVLSPECTYHQPIIPDAWIQELTASTVHGSPEALNNERRRA